MMGKTDQLASLPRLFPWTTRETTGNESGATISNWLHELTQFTFSLFFSSYFQQQSLQPKFLPTANKLHQLGFTLYATEATAQYLNEHNISAEPVEWPLHSVGVNPTATR